MKDERKEERSSAKLSSFRLHPSSLLLILIPSRFRCFARQRLGQIRQRIGQHCHLRGVFRQLAWVNFIECVSRRVVIVEVETCVLPESEGRDAQVCQRRDVCFSFFRSAHQASALT